MRFFSKSFADLVLCKMAESLISVKYQVILLTFGLDFYLLKLGVENNCLADVSGNIVALTTGIIGAIIVMREGFKITSLKTNGYNKEPKDKNNE